MTIPPWATARALSTREAVMQNTARTSGVVESLQRLAESELSHTAWPEEFLLDVIRPDSTALKARLYACEILLRRDQERFLAIISAPTVAAVYVSALKEKATADLNLWAFLGQGDLGPMGRHLVACGESAVMALAPLLDMRQPAGIYGGSKESKLGNSDYARICDLAAFFIARIRGFPYTFHRDSMALRDAETERIKKRLPQKP